uniref:phosphotransferase n=1 Tax=Nocardioides dongxiaopingii TaxID=2576036 RepID=UPI001BAE6FD3
RVHAAAPPDVVAATPGDPVDLLVADLGGPAPPPPGLALGLRWLREHAPARRDPVLVHGDLRLGNVVVDPDGLAALLDWELVHVGDPLEDLGWLCAKVWRFGAASPVGGLGSREDLLDGYAGVAGWRPGLDELRWWELWGTVRWGLMCGVMAERHLSGVERSVELVAIGRRACEQEHDVLLELGHVAVGDGVPAASAGPAGAAGGVHGRPTALDLLGGVRDYLEAGPMRLPGAAGFEARVARGVLDTVVRELAATDDERAHARLLAGLGCRDDAELARAVEHGTHDDRWDDVLAAVVDGVLRRVRAASPRHLADPSVITDGSAGAHAVRG